MRIRKKYKKRKYKKRKQRGQGYLGRDKWSMWFTRKQKGGGKWHLGDIIGSIF